MRRLSCFAQLSLVLGLLVTSTHAATIADSLDDWSFDGSQGENGWFNGYTCFGEAWLRATNGTAPTGAIGCYASSINQEWNPPMAGQDEMVDLLVADEKRTFGGLCFNGSMLMMDEYGTMGQKTFLTWHIFGDPSLRVRTDTPAALTISHDEYLDPAATTFTTMAAGEVSALPNASVTVSVTTNVPC